MASDDNQIVRTQKENFDEETDDADAGRCLGLHHRSRVLRAGNPQEGREEGRQEGQEGQEEGRRGREEGRPVNTASPSLQPGAAYARSLRGTPSPFAPSLPLALLSFPSRLIIMKPL